MVKERIIQLLEYKSIPKEKFFSQLNMTSANFRGNAKQTPLNSEALAKIIANIPDANPMWLLTGELPMLKTQEQAQNVEVVAEPEAQEPQDYKLTFKRRLKELVDSNNISIKQLSELLECSRQHASYLMQEDNNRVVSAPELKKIANYFNTTTDSFFGSAAQKEQSQVQSDLHQIKIQQQKILDLLQNSNKQVNQLAKSNVAT